MIMTAYGSVDSAVKALKSGAYDYVTKPLDMDDLQSKLRRAVETSRLRRKVQNLESSIQERYGVASMVADSPGMKQVVHEIQRLKDTRATVLIQGESGVGKEVVARALHADGNRRGGPFVAVNCGALSETILESELFGHEKGAFTGAVSRHQGAFERADGGTLFLDEVGNAPESVQVRLLRVLEERELLRVGGQTPVSVDVRLVSASNRDLEDLVADGEFREDLLYRLKVVTLSVPPLRERREDIRPLADRFVAMACEDHGRHIASIAPDVYTALETYDWPGNVRQLKNIMESSVIMAESVTLQVSDLRLPDRVAALEAGGDAMQVPDNKTFAEIEKEILAQLLRRHNGNRTLVADKLGISRRTIQRKVKDYNLPY
jgi:DNA-binding NtrC family response regulator